MKKIFIWLVVSLLFTMVGCVEGLHESGMTETSSEQLPNLTAGFAEGETRTYVESGKYLRWHEDDRLTSFYGNTLNRQYKFNGATGDNSGSFSYVSSGNLETGNALDCIYAVYPYDETITITDDGQISLTLPAVQTYAENSFGRGANTMLAVTENLEDTFLPFKNVCGYLKLKLYKADGATIKSIEVKGNGEEKISGAATATIDFGEAPQLTMTDDATTTITLDCGDGVTLGTTAEAATEFWVVIPETTFEGGITITVTDTEGVTFEQSTTKEVVIERNAIQPMATLSAEFLPKPALNEIWYTNGSTTEATTPYKTNVFGANIVSNTYDAEKECWVIKFDGEVTSIGDYAFYSCSSLTSVTIPDSVTTISRQSFASCSSLTSVTISDSITEIGEFAFYSCKKLKSITIPDSVTTISSQAFNYCSSLTSVTFGNGVTTIGEGAFQYCTSLTSVTIPGSVTEMSSAFRYCSSLTSVTFGNGVATIGSYAFNDCSSLTSVTIPDSVTKIGQGAFYGCEKLKSIAIPDSVMEIGDSAFRECSRLTNITIPDGVTTIGSFAFDDCSTLTSVTIPDSVTSIGSYAFRYCSSLTNITIPDGVTEIGNNAFYECSSLTSVTIPNSLTTIGYYAFSGCTNLTEFKGNFAEDNGRIVVINGTLIAFASAGLTGYVIPDSVTEIGHCAFLGCKNLTSVIIPDSVTTIGENAFQYCSSLTSITIPDSVTTIGEQAFCDCSSLTSVTIPDSVTLIGRWAFCYCSSLASVYCKAITPPAISIGYYSNWEAFAANKSARKIYVPAESVEAYKTADGWSEHASDIVAYDF